MAKQANEGKDVASKMQKSSEEKEVVARKYDEEKAATTMKKLNDEIRARKEAEKLKEAELQKVAVKEEDVTLVADQLDISTSAAKRELQLHGGDLRKTLRQKVGLTV